MGDCNQTPPPFTNAQYKNFNNLYKNDITKYSQLVKKNKIRITDGTTGKTYNGNGKLVPQQDNSSQPHAQPNANLSGSPRDTTKYWLQMANDFGKRAQAIPQSVQILNAFKQNTHTLAAEYKPNKIRCSIITTREDCRGMNGCFYDGTSCMNNYTERGKAALSKITGGYARLM